MKRAKGQRSEAAPLRQRAEELFRAKERTTTSPQSEAEAQRLHYELEIHQIELEMQNEELNRARDEQEAVLEKYTDLYDFAPVGYFTFDRSGTISAANLTAASLLGIERSRLLGRRFALYLAEDARSGFAQFLQKVFTSRSKESGEVTLVPGEDRPNCLQLEAMVDKSGQECRVAVIDISSRRQAETMIERLNADLAAYAAEREAANRELETFNYSVAHDLRNPLNAISSYCQVIKELCGNQLDEQCRDYLQKAYNTTLKMNRLIEALLDFSRIVRVEPQRERVDLGAVASEVISMLKLTAPERQVDFQVAPGLSAEADSNLLRVVLNNLLDNAWKYTGRCQEAIITFGMTRSAGKPAYFVRDNGAGFDMADADKLFIPFQRLPGAEECRGFGIGLATVERIIRRHGGRVWAEGELGKGATFYFTVETEPAAR